jgi:hypothetical protein
MHFAAARVLLFATGNNPVLHRALLIVPIRPILRAENSAN